MAYRRDNNRFLILIEDQPPVANAKTHAIASLETLHIAMPVPHGGELGVFTPRGHFLYVVAYQAESQTPGNGASAFSRQGSLRLRVARAAGSLSPDGARVPIFSDTGVYRFRISEESELSASLMCTVRYLK